MVNPHGSATKNFVLSSLAIALFGCNALLGNEAADLADVGQGGSQGAPADAAEDAFDERIRAEAEPRADGSDAAASSDRATVPDGTLAPEAAVAVDGGDNDARRDGAGLDTGTPVRDASFEETTSGPRDAALESAAVDAAREACVSTPVTVFDATPAGTCGSVCTASNALASDGAWAGLDCTGGGFATIDGVDVTACIAADFGTVVNLDPVIVRARSIDNACGTACSTGCNTGDAMLVFYGSTLGVYQYATAVTLVATFNDYPVTLGIAARYVLICRNGSGQFRDDVAVDSIRSGRGC
jgi:hypothetical protein